MLSSLIDRVTYTGSNSTAVYSYGCRITAATDILATVRNISTGAETTLVITTDYTVASVGQATGNITLVNASQAWLDGSGNLANTYKLTIRRVRPLTQNASFRNQGSFYAATHEDAFDNQTMVAQQQEDEISRSVKLSETTLPADFNPILPSTVGLASSANCSLMINGTNNGFAVGPSASAIAAAQTQALAAAASATAAAASATAAALSATAAAASATASGPVVTGSRASAQSIVAGTGILFVGIGPLNIWFIKGTGGVVITANPQIAAGITVGQILILFGTDDTNFVEVQDGTGLDLNGPWIGGNGSRLELMWDGTNWSESSRR